MLTKKIIGTTILIALKLSAYSQATLPANYPSATLAPINYIRTWDVSAPIATEAGVLAAPLQDVRQATQYLDGLSRPLQTVIKQGSLATGNAPQDFVIPTVYDNVGREQYKYLPFAANSTGGNTSISDGLFKRNPFQQQQSFAAIQYPGEHYFYSKTTFETSPLNRIERTNEVGDTWAENEGAAFGFGKNINKKMFTNTLNDAVWIWDVVNGSVGTWSNYLSSANYLPGQLIKIINTDENGKQLIEFKDKAGQIVLKKVQMTASDDNGLGNDNVGWLCTYYVYDDFGNLSCVIPPKAVATMPSNRTFGTNVLSELCFRYEYDGRKRMIMKQVPGGGTFRMVYDALDRIVLMQDANMSTTGNPKWQFTKYDQFSRPTVTGLWTTSSTWATLQNLAYNSVDFPILNGSSFEFLSTINYGENTPANLRVTLDDAAFNTNSTIFPYPQPLEETKQVRGLVINTWVKEINVPNRGYNTSLVYDEEGRQQQSIGYNQDRDMTLVTKQYNYVGQILQSVTRQELIGPNQTHVVKTKTSYDDLGRPLTVQKEINSILAGNIQVNKPWVTISSQQYDALGQLKNKKLSPNYNSGVGLENLAYNYNIRGWITDLNKDFLLLNSNNYFGFQLGYDKTSTVISGSNYNTPAYNGNISGSTWRSKGDGERRKYDYSYDVTNRLLKADFTQYTGGSFNSVAGIDFSMKLGDGINPQTAYDENGNILTMEQKGLKINASSVIDNLRYTYTPNSNKLKSVTDFSNDPLSQLGDFKTNTTHFQNSFKSSLTPTSTPNDFDLLIDYDYDANGNIKLDNNKNISNISYNHLNLPEVISIPGKGTITYVYEATGNKIKKIISESNATVSYNGGNYVTDISTSIDYRSGFVYESKSYTNNALTALGYSNLLQFFPQEEGRVRYKPSQGTTSGSYEYDYMIKDHLGNIRAVITEEQRQDVYPAATLESSTVSIEDDYYNIVTSQIVTPPLSGSPTYTNGDNGISNVPPNPVFEASNSTKAYKLNTASEATKTGLGITLKVMAGDKIDVFGKSFYQGNNTGNTNNLVDPLTIISGFLGGTTGGSVTGIHGPVSPTNVTQGIGPGSILAMITDQGNQAGSVNPRAFLNVIFFDEQFKAVGYHVSLAGQPQHHTDLHDLVVPKNGFAYIYCSDESPIDVYFDNVQVVHTRGQLLEETHYYPFGLVMNGISYKAANITPNSFKFNKGNEFQSNEYSDGSGLELYDALHRMYDPQIGRFMQIDELAEANYEYTPYSFALNNPVNFNDPSGLTEEKPVTTASTNLPVVVIYSKRVLTHQQMVTKYWELRNAGNGFVGVSQKLKERMERWDKTQRFLEEVHRQTRESDKIVLEIASFFVPTGWITKLKYVKYAVNIYKIRRAALLAKIVSSKPLITVLGKAGWQGIQGYEKVAAEMGYNSFQVSDKVWKAMTDAERWAANSTFLAEVVARGDQIVFSKHVAAISGEVGYFRKELEYLVEKGYKLSSDGLGMVK